MLNHTAEKSVETAESANIIIYISVVKVKYLIYCIILWSDSSVGRAGDWKSPCQWFDSTSDHQKLI